VNGHVGAAQRERLVFSKRFNVEQAEDTLQQFGLTANPEQGNEPTLPAPGQGALSPSQSVDLLTLNEITGGDHEFAADLAQSYKDSSGELLTKIRDCFVRGDRYQLAREVHQLAGASANVCAAPLRELCSDLERAAETATEAQLEQRIAQLAAELARVTVCLAGLIGDCASVSAHAADT